MNSYVHIGKLVASHGLQGEVILQHQLGRLQAPRNLKVVFLEPQPRTYLPYFVDRLIARKEDELVLKLEGISTKEQTRPLIPKKVYLPEASFQEQVDPESALFLLGFEVMDSKEGVLGTVEEIIQLPAQWIVKVPSKGKELLLPINEQTLVGMDRKKRLLELDLPDGLLDIY